MLGVSFIVSVAHGCQGGDHPVDGDHVDVLHLLHIDCQTICAVWVYNFYGVMVSSVLVQFGNHSVCVITNQVHQFGVVVSPSLVNVCQEEGLVGVALLNPSAVFGLCNVNPDASKDVDQLEADD